VLISEAVDRDSQASRTADSNAKTAPDERARNV
jgi:hypothetical protein